MEPIPRAALWLGLVGIVPFWLAVLGYFSGFAMSRDQAVAVALAYGGLTLGFLGGIRWGAALGPIDEGARTRQLIMSTGPVLVGLAAFFLAPVIGLSLIIGGLFLQALSDVMSADRGLLPRWFGRLRAILTVLAVIPVMMILTALVAGE